MVEEKAMNKPEERFRMIVEFALPWFVLAVLLIYTYVSLFEHTCGFDWETNGQVYEVYVNQPAPDIKVGDQLVKVGSLTWDEFHNDLRKTFFDGVKKGQVVPVVVQRGGQLITVQWILPGSNRGELLAQVFSEWFLAYIFWMAGAVTMLFLRPKDERWVMLTAFNFLTAIWLASGSGASNFHLLYSALLLRMAIWLSLPVYLHLHWLFPRSLGKLPPLVVGAGYMVALVLIIAQGFQVLPQSLYFFGFLIAIIGSLVLLVIHAVRQPDTRADLRLLLVAVFLALAPVIILSGVDILTGISSRAGTLGLLSFPLVPFAYLYAIYRRQLGGLEVRVNRLTSAYAFMIVLGTVGIPFFVLADKWLPNENNTLIVGSLSTLVATVLSLWFFPRFQNFVEHRMLGIPVATEQIQQTYSTQTSARTSINALVDLLRDVMLPSLLVRQFLFVQFDRELIKVLLAVGLDEKQLPGNRDLSRLSTFKDDAPGDINKARPYPWVRLVLPLKVGNDVIGLCLLGRRDPDDYYSQVELPMLQSLANQTAIALSNIIQTERLHAAYQDGIKRSEDARKQIALELHDGVLNKMAALMMKLDGQIMTPEFQKSYNELTTQVREIVKDLRPSMLNYGLQLALEGYADTLRERSKGKVRIVADIKSDGARYSPDVEQHVFRIVQEASMNALRHAKPTQITISGRLEKELIEIDIRDDGSGIDSHEKLDLNALQAANHFGMSGIFERAELIGAEIKIESEPGKGTRIQICWKPGKI